MSDFLEIPAVPVAPATWRQLGVLTLDASGSMSLPVDSLLGGSKAEAVNLSVREMFTRFKVGRKVDNFSFGIVDFHDTVSHVEEPVPARSIDDNASFDPTAHGMGGTFIGSGLEEAHRMCKDFLAQSVDGLPSTAIILAMSDGECLNAQATIQIAEEIKRDNRITIAAALFATKGASADGAQLLQKICSDPTRFYKTVYDAETLRNFFTASMTAAIQSAGLDTSGAFL